ncbi:MAG: ABC transporter permease subunit [Burkholderiales bacterium]|nr:ABC transporter permease subunit [Anaerolineae bacterium]
MAMTSDPQHASSAVYYDEPPTKTPPLLAVGWLAWVRENLFRTWFDTALTIGATLFVVGSVTSFLSWAIGQANWFVIIFNIRQFMIGRYEAEAEWRVQLLTLLIAFVIGFSLATWSRVSRVTMIVIAVALLVMIALPIAIEATTPLPPNFLTAGNVDVVSGSSTETPQPQLAFIGAAGTEITLQLPANLSGSDNDLAAIASFTDNAANIVRNAALNRLATAERIEELEAQLAGDLLTDSQREALTAELDGLEIPPPVTETYLVNQLPIQVRILDGASLEPLAETTLEPGGAAFSFALPADGWYVLEKNVVAEGDQTAVSLMTVTGICPLLERNLLTAAAPVTADGAVDTTATGPASGGSTRVLQYICMTNDFMTNDPRPSVEGDDVPMAIIIDNQYRGESGFSDYVRLYLAPFLERINFALVLIAIAVAVGYVASRFADRTFSPREKPRKASQRTATWLWVALPILMLVLVHGIDAGYGENRWLVGLLTIVIYGYIMSRFWSYLLRKPILMILSIALIPVIFVALIPALNVVSGILNSVLPLTDPRRWGGLLLTMLLTVAGIVVSFPFGVGLALGRRSKLPIVRTFCTLYIEFVRGVPFIAVLFFVQLLLPLVDPNLASIPGALRAMGATIVFSAAYLAENVRGGLQAVPPGQEEAAKAVGLAGWQIILFITLPQALRVVIPALVGQFISLFKDTSLVSIVGLIDLTGIAKAVVAQTEFIALNRETYIFISLLYFIFSYMMAAASRRIEASGVGLALRR